MWIKNQVILSPLGPVNMQAEFSMPEISERQTQQLLRANNCPRNVYDSYALRVLKGKWKVDAHPTELVARSPFFAT